MQSFKASMSGMLTKIQIAKDQAAAVVQAQAGKVKNDRDWAKIFSDLFEKIFGMVDAVIDVAETALTANNPWGSGHRKAMDDLNFSAQIIQYTLADIFAGLLALTWTAQSANIKLTANGELGIGGQKIIHDCCIQEAELKTLDHSVRETLRYVAKAASIGPILVQVAGIVSNLATGWWVGKRDYEEEL
jgi:hypothetical protein